MENVDKSKKRKKSHPFFVIIVCLLIFAIGIWAVYFQGRGYDTNAIAHVDGTIETEDSAVDLAYQKEKDAQPCSIISDTSSSNKKIALIFEGLSESSEENEKIRNSIKDSGMKTSFALSAAEALGNKEYLKKIVKDGEEIISNGANGESNMHLKSSAKMIASMLKSRESLSNSVNKNISLLYYESTQMTGDVLKSARVSGYDSVVNPSFEHIVDKSTFQEESDAEDFINGLNGDTIVVFNLRGIVSDIKNEDSVVAEKPAIDKQADLDDSSEEKKENPELSQQVQWLIDALVKNNVETSYVSDFEITDGLYALRSEVEKDNPSLSIVYRYCLTEKNQIGVGIKGITNDDTFSSYSEYNPVTIFLTEDELENIRSKYSSNVSIGMYVSNTELIGKEADEVFDLLYEKEKKYAMNDAYVPVCLIDDVEGVALQYLRAVAKQLNFRIICPDTPKKMTSGMMYVLDSKQSNQLQDIKKEAVEKNLICSDIYSLLENAGTIGKLSAEEVRTLRENNEQKKAQVQNYVNTTERVASFNFYNLGNDAVVEDILNQLMQKNAKATFFVTLDELMTRTSAIEKIIQSGNEVGIHYQVNNEYPENFNSEMNYLNSWMKYAAWAYDIESNVLYVTNSSIKDVTKEVAHAEKLKIVKNTVLVVRNEDKDITIEDVQKVMDELSTIRLMRGSFVFFNANFYANDKDARQGSIIGKVIDAFFDQYVDSAAYKNVNDEIEDDSRFKICESSYLVNDAKQYKYNNDAQNDIKLDKNILTNMSSDEERFEYIKNHYYGNVTVNVSDKLPGFSAEEIEKLDKVGTFTDDKTLFLSFDDWGTEESINELLYVLDKYNVKATFFIKTNYVDENPNLLRTIAEHGHQIACHTDGHIPLADSVNGNDNHTTSLTDEEALALREDLVTAYNKLYKYVGDVTVNGKKALTRMFRPPTLAVSKIGLEQVFDTGYSYSISGEYSTGDYEATSYEDMIARLTSREIGNNQYVTIENGTVIVMHMQENAKYTAQALDTMIPKWQEEGYSFSRIDDYLGE